MLEKLGKERFAAPVMVIIVVFCILALVMYPMLNAIPKNVPFALLNLDEGVDMPTGAVNMGNEITKTMLEGVELQEGVESPLAWTEFTSETELNAALENNEFYGAIIIPADFTAAQMAVAAASAGSAGTGSATAASGMDPETALTAAIASGMDPEAAVTALLVAGADPQAVAAAAVAAGIDPGVVASAATAAAEAAAAADTSTEVPALPTIQVIINQGKNVMLATTMQTALSTMLGQTGLNIEMTTIHAADVSGGGMAAMMSGMVVVTPTVLLSLACSILLYLLFRPGKDASKAERVKAYGKQLVYAVVASGLAACAAVLLVTWVGGMEVPVASVLLFLWLSSFSIMALFIGALDIAMPLGALVIICCFALGMGTAMLAYEMLPAFWQDWVYPWAPQRFVGSGVGSILYMSRDAWNDSSLPLAITGCIGLVLMALAVFIPQRKVKEAA